MAKILIVGCGDVGGRLAIELVGAGHEVHGLRRSSFTLAGVRAVQADVTQAASLQFPEALDYVFIILTPAEPGAEAYRRVYYDGSRNVLQALAGQKLRRIFWVSSSSVYGQQDGDWVDEETPVLAKTATARILCEAEALVQDSGLPVTIVRFAGIYGPGRVRLLRWVQAARPVQEQPVLWTNRIHVEDCAGLLFFLLAQDIAGTLLAPLYIGVDHQPAPQHEVLDWLADTLGLPRVARASRPGAGSNKRLSNQRISALGYCWRFPGYEAGYREIIRSAWERL